MVNPSCKKKKKSIEQVHTKEWFRKCCGEASPSTALMEAK